ncbi:MAG: 8-oxoguanine DNA glycosylase [Oscillospiraceae bacterium]|jgi:N-glycosylase/DNA lyase|nr:8-oxoguanine DNA glycosylase [Oscillospiraceae bacterium]
MLIVSNWLNLNKIAASGQCFLWKKDGESYSISHMGRTIAARQIEDDTVMLDCSKEEYESVWRGYFDMNADYDAYYNAVDDGDEYLINACEYSRGLRMLRQDFWECTVSFIISQNNNIPRIQKCVDTVCGKENTLPPPHQLLAEFNERVLPARMGYRERYLELAAEKFIADQPKSFIHEMSYGDAFRYLTSFVGIGPKVANCVCLYSLHHMEAFPRDVWVKRIEELHYKHCGGFPEKRYPDCCGMLQLFMFCYERRQVKIS